MTTTNRKADKEFLSPAGRALELLFVFLMLLLFAFFVYHQLANTGFFTEKFGTLEMLALYVPIVVAAAAPVIRALTGRRNPARPFEIAGNLLTALAGLWFLIVFPFNFAHFADALPAGIRFIFAWINDDIGRIPLILQVILGPISAIINFGQYLRERGRETVLMSQRRV